MITRASCHACFYAWLRKAHPILDFTLSLFCFAPLHSTPLHSTPLHSTPLHSTPLHSTLPYSSLLYYTLSVLLCSAPCWLSCLLCSLLCSATLLSTLYPLRSTLHALLRSTLYVLRSTLYALLFGRRSTLYALLLARIRSMLYALLFGLRSMFYVLCSALCSTLCNLRSTVYALRSSLLFFALLHSTLFFSTPLLLLLVASPSPGLSNFETQQFDGFKAGGFRDTCWCSNSHPFSSTDQWCISKPTLMQFDGLLQLPLHYCHGTKNIRLQRFKVPVLGVRLTIECG